MNLRDLQFDKSLAITGFFFSILLMMYLGSGHNVIYLVPCFLLLLICLMWILHRKNVSLELLELNVSENYSITLLLSSLFFLLLTLSILSVFYRQNQFERPLIYFVLTSLLVGIVALEILFVPSNKLTKLILAQIIIIVLSLLWTQESIFPIIGIDPIWHRMFTLKILEYGHVPQGYSYSGIPLFHLLIASTSLITGLNYELSSFLSASFIYAIISILIVFLIGIFLFSKKLGLFCSLFLCTSNIWIQFGWWVIPNSIAMVFVSIIIYLIYKLQTENPLTTSCLIIFFMFSVVLTHTITSVWLGLILVQTWVFSFVTKKIKTKTIISMSLTLTILFITFMFSWWIYASGFITLFVKLISWGFNIDQVLNTTVLPHIGESIPIEEQLFDKISEFSFLSFSFLGFFYMISRKGNEYTFSIASLGIGTFAIGFLSQIGGLIAKDRFLFLSQIILVFLETLGFFLFLNLINKRILKILIFFALISTLTFSTIISTTANTDNHMLAPDIGIRFAFIESEMDAASFFSKNSVGNISSDFDYGRNPSSNLFTNNFNFPSSLLISLDDSLYYGNFIHDKSIKIIRKEIINKPFRLECGVYCIPYNPNVLLSSSGFYKIYDSNTVCGYI